MNYRFTRMASRLVMVSLLLSSCASGTITQRGLVSFYPFDGKAEDQTGNHHGKESNIQYKSLSEASSDKVLVLNGDDSYVDLTTPFDYDEITISLWFNVHSFDTQTELIFTADYASQRYGLMNLATKNEYGVNNVYFNLSGEIEKQAIKTNVWYHATLIKKENKRYEYYLNGVLIGSGAIDQYLSSVRGFPVAQIGTIRTRELGFFDGAVNNLRIYNRALSEKEVATLANEMSQQ